MAEAHAEADRFDLESLFYKSLEGFKLAGAACLAEHGYAVPSDIYKPAVRSGSLQIVQWAHQHAPDWQNTAVVRAVVESGKWPTEHLDIVGCGP